jgi:NhaP-type Na+/H+ or K+/H+ antiporter
MKSAVSVAKYWEEIMLTSLAFIFLTGILLSYVFNRMKLPGLLGMLLAGILLGPYALNAIDISVLGISADLRQLALVIILTRAGLSLNINDLKNVGLPAVLMCFVPACFEIGAMVLIAPRLLGISVLEAAIGGIPLAMGLSCGDIVLTVAVLSILITAPLGAIGVDLTYNKWLSLKTEQI